MTSKNSSSTFLPQASSIIDNSSCILGLRLARTSPPSLASLAVKAPPQSRDLLRAKAQAASALALINLAFYHLTFT